MPSSPSGQIVKASDAISTIGDMLAKHEAQIAMALPSEVSVKRLIRVAITTMRKTPALAQCSAASLCGAVIQAAQLGLDVDSNLGHAYLVKYGNECVLIIGYRGMLDLAYRSDRISKIEAEAVYEGDTFKVVKGDDAKIIHEPCFEDDPDKITHVYATATLTNGDKISKVMTRKQIDNTRDRSRAGKSGPWVTDYLPMALKTVIRQLFKVIPSSVTAQRAAGLDEAADANLSQRLDVEWKAVTEQEPIEVEATPIDSPRGGPAGQGDYCEDDFTPATDAELRKQCGTMAVEVCGDDKQAIGDWFEQACGVRSVKPLKGDALGEAHKAIRDAFTKWGTA